MQGITESSIECAFKIFVGGLLYVTLNEMLIYIFISDEINLLITEIRRLENALQSTELPMQIARDCLGNRQRRIDTDLVQDNAEKQLLKVSKISNIIISFDISFYAFILTFDPQGNLTFKGAKIIIQINLITGT